MRAFASRGKSEIVKCARTPLSDSFGSGSLAANSATDNDNYVSQTLSVTGKRKPKKGKSEFGTLFLSAFVRVSCLSPRDDSYRVEQCLCLGLNSIVR